MIVKRDKYVEHTMTASEILLREKLYRPGEDNADWPPMIATIKKQAWDAAVENDPRVAALVEVLDRAIQSLQMHRDKGHNDTCGHALSEEYVTEYVCDCGFSRARNIVRDGVR